MKKVVDIFLIRYYIIHINKVGKGNKRKTEEPFRGRYHKMKREKIFFGDSNTYGIVLGITERHSLERKPAECIFNKIIGVRTNGF